MSAESLNLEPPKINVQAEGGNDVTYTAIFPYNATAGTHTLLIAETADGVAIASYASGTGLTVGAYASGVTRVAVAIPRAFTLTHRKKTLFFSYQLVLSSLLRTQFTGSFTLGGGIYAPAP